MEGMGGGRGREGVGEGGNSFFTFLSPIQPTLTLYFLVLCPLLTAIPPVAASLPQHLAVVRACVSFLCQPPPPHSSAHAPRAHCVRSPRYFMLSVPYPNAPTNKKSEQQKKIVGKSIASRVVLRERLIVITTYCLYSSKTKKKGEGAEVPPNKNKTNQNKQKILHPPPPMFFPPLFFV